MENLNAQQAERTSGADVLPTSMLIDQNHRVSQVAGNCNS